MSRVLVNGISSGAAVGVVVLILAAIGAAGYLGTKRAEPLGQNNAAGKAAQVGDTDALDINVPGDSLELEIAPRYGQKIVWNSTGDSAIQIRFAGPMKDWPCKEAKEAADSGKKLDKWTLANPCTVRPEANSLTFAYRCTRFSEKVGSSYTQKEECADPGLGPISAPGGGFTQQVTPSSFTDKAVHLKRHSSGLVTLQIACDGNTPRVYNPADYDPDQDDAQPQPVTVKKGDSITWKFSGPGIFPVFSDLNPLCENGNDVSLGCNVKAEPRQTAYNYEVGACSGTGTYQVIVK